MSFSSKTGLAVVCALALTLAGNVSAVAVRDTSCVAQITGGALCPLAFCVTSAGELRRADADSTSSCQHFKASGYNIKSVERGMWNGFQALKSVDLSHNKITEIKKVEMPNTPELIVSYNNIAHIRTDDVNRMPKLKYLDVEHNDLIYFSQVDGLQVLAKQNAAVNIGCQNDVAGLPQLNKEDLTKQGIYIHVQMMPLDSFDARGWRNGPDNSQIEEAKKCVSAPHGF
jgi:hypothetical protein